MMYAGQDDWVHINCALWSAETYEEEDGGLRNVHAAIVRGRKLVLYMQHAGCVHISAYASSQ